MSDFQTAPDNKHFAEKLEAILGLYLNPPEHAVVLSCDEKSQMQALDRTQPGLPIKRGRAETMTRRSNPLSCYISQSSDPFQF